MKFASLQKQIREAYSQKLILALKKLADVRSTVLFAEGARPKRWSMDLRKSVGSKPSLLGSSGVMEGTLLWALWSNVGHSSYGTTH
jgi:hypothetical protein